MRICSCEMSVAETRSIEIYAISVYQNFILGEKLCAAQQSKGVVESV